LAKDQCGVFLQKNRNTIIRTTGNDNNFLAAQAFWMLAKQTTYGTGKNEAFCYIENVNLKFNVENL